MTEKYKNIDVSYDFKGNHIANFAIISSATAPINPKVGYLYHDSEHDVVKYYNGTEWKAMPYLDGEYKIPVGLLNVIDSTGDLSDASDENIPTTALFVKEISQLIPASSIVTEWSASPSDENIPSEKLTKDTLDENYAQLDSKIDESVETLNGEIESLGTEIGQEIERLDDKIDTGLASKLDDEQVIDDWEALNPEEVQIPSAVLMSDSLDSKVDDSQITSMVTSEADKIPSGMAVTMALNDKTDVTMAIRPWNAGLIYNTDSTVIAGSTIYISVQDGNVNHDPLDDTEEEWWKQITGSGGGGGGSSVNGKTIVFGNALETEYELIHNMSTYDFIWSLRTTESPREYVSARIQAIDRTKVKVILSSPPGSNALTLNLVALKSKTSPTIIDDVTIAEPADMWSYANDTGNPLFIQTYDSSGNQIYGDISQTSANDFNPVITGFTSPKSGRLVVVKTPYIFEFNDADTWIISHNLGRLVAVQCFSDTDGQITGDLIQNANSAVVSFSEKKTGYAVVAVPNLIVEFTNQTDWTVEHGLNRFVAVQTFDTAGDQMFGNIEQDGNSVTVSFSNPKSGYMLIM